MRDLYDEIDKELSKMEIMALVFNEDKDTLFKKYGGCKIAEKLKEKSSDYIRKVGCNNEIFKYRRFEGESFSERVVLKAKNFHNERFKLEGSHPYFKPNLSFENIDIIFESYKDYLMDKVLDYKEDYNVTVYRSKSAYSDEKIYYSENNEKSYARSLIIDQLNKNTLPESHINLEVPLDTDLLTRNVSNLTIPVNLYNYIYFIRRYFIDVFVPYEYKHTAELLFSNLNITLLELVIYGCTIIEKQTYYMKISDIFDILIYSIYLWAKSQYYVSKDSRSENIKNAINEWIDHYNSYEYMYDWEKCKFEKRDPQNPLHNKIYLAAKYIGGIIYRYNKKYIKVDQEDLEKLYKIIGIYMNKESDE